MMSSMSATELIRQHEAAGRYLDVGGLRTFVREEGSGDAVLCIHGVPASGFLYRKVIAELAQRGLRGISYDYPGLGLTARPADFDYSWSGLGRFTGDFVNALGLDRFHLVVHDIGGPIGFELAAAMPERIRSLTILNTVMDAERFRPPWVMKPFRAPFLRHLYLATMVGPLFRILMRLIGVYRQDRVSGAELDAYVDLLKRDDGGRAFLKIMRAFEIGSEKNRLYREVVGSAPYPVQIVWGEHDPALPPGKQGEWIRQQAGLKEIQLLPGRHFLQEDNAPELADRIAAFVGGK